MKMRTSARTSIGFLLVGILGVLVGALVVAFVYGRTSHTNDSAGAFTAASALPLSGGAVDLEQRIVSVVKQTEPSVVLIKATVRGQQINPFFNDPLFRQFFGEPFGGQSQPFIAHASGSGFVIKRSGDTALVATNAHVIYNADHIEVLLYNGRKVAAEKVGSDIRTDLALLRISGDNLPPALTLGNSGALQQGQFVIAIGEPESFQNSVSFGIVSALHRSVTAGGGETFGIPNIRYGDLLQTTAPINPGNSGGPLINLRGQVVGITAVVDPRAQAIGFAIPISAAQPILGQLETHKTIAHPFIGIVMTSVNDQIANYLGYRGKSGVVITNVVPGSPAEKAGLQQGDVVVELDHKKVTSPDEIHNTVAQMKVGGKVSLLVWRDGNLQPVDVTLAQEPENLPQG